jgi:hypothetical protein
MPPLDGLLLFSHRCTFSAENLQIKMGYSTMILAFSIIDVPSFWIGKERRRVARATHCQLDSYHSGEGGYP